MPLAASPGEIFGEARPSTTRRDSAAVKHHAMARPAKSKALGRTSLLPPTNRRLRPSLGFRRPAPVDSVLANDSVKVVKSGGRDVNRAVVINTSARCPAVERENMSARGRARPSVRSSPASSSSSCAACPSHQASPPAQPSATARSARHMHVRRQSTDPVVCRTEPPLRRGWPKSARGTGPDRVDQPRPLAEAPHEAGARSARGHHRRRQGASARARRQARRNPAHRLSCAPWPGSSTARAP